MYTRVPTFPVSISDSAGKFFVGVNLGFKHISRVLANFVNIWVVLVRFYMKNAFFGLKIFLYRTKANESLRFVCYLVNRTIIRRFVKFQSKSFKRSRDIQSFVQKTSRINVTLAVVRFTRLLLTL